MTYRCATSPVVIPAAAMGQEVLPRPVPYAVAAGQMLAIGLGTATFYVAGRIGEARMPLRTAAVGTIVMVAANIWANYRLYGTVWPYGEQPAHEAEA